MFQQCLWSGAMFFVSLEWKPSQAPEKYTGWSFEPDRRQIRVFRPGRLNLYGVKNVKVLENAKR
jgi:hypothetical protein